MYPQLAKLTANVQLQWWLKSLLPPAMRDVLNESCQQPLKAPTSPMSGGGTIGTTLAGGIGAQVGLCLPEHEPIPTFEGAFP